MTNAHVRLRGGQECCNNLQNLRIAHCGVVESGGIDEGHHSSVEGKIVREFDLGCARLQAQSDPQIRTTGEIDKLKARRVSFWSLLPSVLCLQLIFRSQSRPLFCGDG